MAHLCSCWLGGIDGGCLHIDDAAAAGNGDHATGGQESGRWRRLRLRLLLLLWLLLLLRLLPLLLLHIGLEISHKSRGYAYVCARRYNLFIERRNTQRGILLATKVGGMAPANNVEATL